jgi:hypothetical protein
MKNKEKFFIFIFFTYKKKEKTSENYHMSEYNNRLVYKDGKDHLSKIFRCNNKSKKIHLPKSRECMKIIILDEEVEYWRVVGIYNVCEYWVVKCGGTQIGLHTMYWIWMNRRHSDEGNMLGFQCR